MEGSNADTKPPGGFSSGNSKNNIINHRFRLFPLIIEVVSFPLTLANREMLTTDDNEYLREVIRRQQSLKKTTFLSG